MYDQFINFLYFAYKHFHGSDIFVLEVWQSRGAQRTYNYCVINMVIPLTPCGGSVGSEVVTSVRESGRCAYTPVDVLG